MRTHLCCSIDGLIRQINNTKTIKAKNKLALAFLSSPKIYPDPYVQLLMILGEYKAKGREVFTDGVCDNVKENGSCGGHEE